jgi:predicted MFS family arabinose efflux permease
MVFLVNLARVLFAPLVQPAAAEFDVTAASLGIVTSAAWFGSATPRLPTGYLLTRVPRHHVIVATGALLVCSSLFTAVAGSIPHLAVGAYLMGLSSGMYFIAANPLVSELFPETVGSAIGIHGMSSQLAAVGAPLAVSAVLLAGDWRLIFYCVAGVAAVATLALVWASRRTALPTAGSADRSLLAAGRVQWPVILTGFAFVAAAGFLWNGLFNLYGDYLEVAKSIPPGTSRLLLSGMFAAGVPAFLVTGRLADRLPNVPLLLGIIGSFVVCVLALTAVEGVVLVALVSLVLGYVIHSMFPAVDTYMLSSLPDQHRASGYALFSAAIMAAQAPGSGVVGLLVVEGMSYTAAFQGLAVLTAVVVAVLFALYRADRLPAGGTPGETPSPTESLD